MLRIDRLSLRLPAGMEHRAGSIAREIGEAWPHMHLSRSERIKRVRLDPVHVGSDATDRAIARAVATQIVRKVGGRP